MPDLPPSPKVVFSAAAGLAAGAAGVPLEILSAASAPNDVNRPVRR